MNEANNAIMSAKSYMNMDRSDFFEEDCGVLQFMQECGQQLSDAQSLMRHSVSTMVSKWESLFQRVLQNLKASLPVDWRKYTLTKPDDEKMLSDFVDHEQNGDWIGLRSALKQSLDTYKKALGQL